MRMNGTPIRAMDLVPDDQRAWVEADPGFRRLFEELESGPGSVLREVAAAELAMRSVSAFKRQFPLVAGRPWGRFVCEWRLLEAWRLLQNPLATPRDARTAVGLKASGRFAASFRRRFGVNPHEVRGAGSSAPPVIGPPCADDFA
jgi:AraC-like DNA-binding protein